MEILLLIFLPFIGSLLSMFCFGRSAQSKVVTLIFSLLSLAFAGYLLCGFDSSIVGYQYTFDAPWILELGIRFYAGIDGISMPLVLLTNGLIPLIILASFKHEYKNPGVFFGLILFMQSGLLLVFTALDAFLFYIGWEAALIPIYFICAMWGGENRIRVHLKFFIYTVLGSLLMLIAIIYVAGHNPSGIFSIEGFHAARLSPIAQKLVFAAFMIAFAIKMPLFPFHTWQPDTYVQAPTAGTMLLAGVMLKMGIYGCIRWLIPVAPMGYANIGPWIILFAIIGVLYASIIAFQQKDIKRLIAYSSIAHVGVIAAGVFVWNVQGLQGAIIQMVNHGINVFALFFIVDIIERRIKSRNSDEMGGLATFAPKLSIAFMIVVLGSVALPLTNGFVGEYLLLLGMGQYNIIATAVIGLSVIFGAVYMLRMYQRVMLGAPNTAIAIFDDIDPLEKLILFICCALIIVIGVYPNCLLHISEASATELIRQVETKLNNPVLLF